MLKQGDNMMDNVIGLEKLKTKPLREAFHNLMALIPSAQREDIFLQRLIAIRLNLDGEDRTRDYIIRKVEQAVQCNYSDSLFHFLKDDLAETACLEKTDDPDPVG